MTFLPSSSDSFSAVICVFGILFGVDFGVACCYHLCHYLLLLVFVASATGLAQLRERRPDTLGFFLQGMSA